MDSQHHDGLIQENETINARSWRRDCNLEKTDHCCCAGADEHYLCPRNRRQSSSRLALGCGSDGRTPLELKSGSGTLRSLRKSEDFVAPSRGLVEFAIAIEVPRYRPVAVKRMRLKGIFSFSRGAARKIRITISFGVKTFVCEVASARQRRRCSCANAPACAAHLRKVVHGLKHRTEPLRP